LSEAAELRRSFMRLPERLRLGYLFCFALSVRLIYLVQIKDSMFFDVLLGDGQAYDAWATAIGQDFWGKRAFFQAPLYPYFLAGIYAVLGRGPLSVRVVQMLLGSAACVLLALAARGFFSKRVGFWSGVVLAVYGPALFFDGIVQKASLDLFLTTLLLYWLSKLAKRDERKFPLLAGVTLGLLALTRENALVWAPCLLAWLAFRRDEHRRRDALARRTLPFALGLVLVLGSVTLRNYAVSGQPLLTTSQFGQNLYIGNNASADGTYQPLRFGHGGAELERRDAIELSEAAVGHPLDASQVSRYWSGRAWQFISQNPLKWLGLMAKKTALVFNARELSDSDEPLIYEDESWLLRGLDRLFGFATLLPLACAGALVSFRSRPELRLLHLLWASLAASTALFFVFARYRYPLVPILLPFAVLAVRELLGALKHGRRKLLFELASAGALGAVVANLDLVAPDHPRAAAHYDLAVSLEQLGRLGDAKVSYRSALAADPDFVEAHVNLGSLLARAGELEQAAAEERAALRRKPDDALAHADLGNVLFEQGRLQEAGEEYARALVLDPRQPQALKGREALADELREHGPGR
jgi:4-amino-4-deoxy-L-arabinose transferase-like glycosyltransferase